MRRFLTICLALFALRPPADGADALTVALDAAPIPPAGKGAEPAWTVEGTRVAGSLQVPAAGEYAVIVDATTGRRKARVEVAVGFTRTAEDFQPGWKSHYAGRVNLAAGTLPIELKVLTLEKGTDAAFTSPISVRLLPLAGAPSGPAAPLELMVPMFHKWQMEKGPERVARCAELGARRVQFVITLQCKLDANLRVKEYGMVLEDPQSAEGSRWYPLTEGIRDQLIRWWTAAFAKAVENDLAIGVLLHLNAHGDITEWRNFFDFDPLSPADGWTYEQGFLLPVYQALRNAVPQDWPVALSLQGEMGTTVMKYPDSWRRMIKRLRQRGEIINLRYGVSLNHESNLGRARLRDVEAPALQGLWRECDFIGVSMYQRMSSPPVAADFSANLERFLVEFDALGAPIPPEKALHMVEVGLGGGGLAPDGASAIPGKEVAHIARSPFLGTSDKARNPWTQPGFTEYRRAYHAALCDFLRTQPARRPVALATLWNYGSWDPCGVESQDFADPDIAAKIRAHNAALPR